MVDSEHGFGRPAPTAFVASRGLEAGSEAGDIANVVLRAADLLDGPGRWVQGAYAKTDDVLHWMRPTNDADCLCLVGALFVAAGWPGAMGVFERGPVCKAVARHLGILPENLTNWNDVKARTQDEVVATLRAVVREGGDL